MAGKFLFGCIVLFAIQTGAQPVADFLLPGAACRQERLTPVNQSTNANTFFWDFTQGDLRLTPTAENLGNLGGNIPYGVKTVFDGSQWFGFIMSRDNNSFIRLDFGGSLANTPTVTTLTGIAGTIRPVDIEFVFADNEWFGFVYGANQLITRFDFGPTLTGTPAATPVITGAGGSDSGLDIAFDGSRWYLAYTIGSPSQLVVAELSSIRAIPTPAQISAHLIDGGSRVLGDVSLIYHNSRWFAYTVSYSGGNELFRARFGANPLLAAPVIEAISGGSFAARSPFGIDIEFDAGEFSAFISTSQGNLYRARLGDDLELPPVSIQDMGTLGGILSNTLKIFLQKEGSRWYGWSANWANNSVYRITFPEAAVAVTPGFSTQPNPDLFFRDEGAFFISLQARAGAAAAEHHARIAIGPDTAPLISIRAGGVCAQTPINFSTQSDMPLTAFAWQFGDGNTSTEPQPTHTFTSTGLFDVQVRAQAANGCFNSARQPTTIVPVPVAAFSLPAAQTICTNQVYLLTNTSVYDAGLPPRWIWELNDVRIDSTKDLSVMFSIAAAQRITLRASLPGCQSTAQQTISNVQAGPVTDFSKSGHCHNALTRFTNATQGEVTGYIWSFGDSQSSNQVSPVHQYALPGRYNVVLTAVNAAGCRNSTTQSLTIFSQPQPDFSLALPPFSCSGSPSQFTDLTPAPTDSNLAAWAWTFGATPPATGTQRNPAFTFAQPGDYNVRLAVTTDQGCTNEIQRTVTILPSPVIDFSFGPACRNQPTLFSSTSSLAVRSHQWTIGTATYTVANPTHVFTSAGSSQAVLRVVANNQCVTTATQTVAVPAELVPEFSVTNACAGQAAVFANTTAAAHDPVRQTDWLIAGAATRAEQAQHIFSAPGAYPVRMQVTGQSGCAYAVVRNVAIHPTPLAGFDPSDEAGPAPFRVVFTNTSVGATAFLWRFNDEQASTSTAANPEFTFTQLGSFPVDLFASNSFQCVSRLTREVRVVIPVPDLELQDFRIVQDPLSNLFVSQADIRNNSNYTIREVPVALNLGLGVAFRENVTGVWRPGAVQTVTLQSRLQALGPPHFACAELLLVNDVQPLNNRRCITLTGADVWLPPYPNPATHTLTVPVVTAAGTGFDLRLVNAVGAVVYQHSMVADGGLAEWTLPVDQLPGGIYVVVLRTASGERTFRVSILR
jgi:PKD repeat protein